MGLETASLFKGVFVGCVFSIGGLLCPDCASAQSRAAPTVAAVCEPCHGLDGVGHDVEIPNIAGQHSIYLRNQLMAFKKGQRKHPEMRYVARELTDREIDELVVYYSTLPPP
jgi:cytochrome c553